MPLYGGNQYGLAASPYGGVASAQQVINDRLRMQHRPLAPSSAATVSPETQRMMSNYRPPAWTAQGRQMAAQEQHQYGTDFFGNRAATGGVGGTGGNSGVGQYQTGITAGIVPPSVVGDAFGRMGVGTGTTTNQYSDLMRQGMNEVGTQFGRDAAFDIADLNLSRQRALADTGLGYGNLLARLFENQLATNRGGRGLTGDFLMGLLG